MAIRAAMPKSIAIDRNMIHVLLFALFVPVVPVVVVVVSPVAVDNDRGAGTEVGDCAGGCSSGGGDGGVSGVGVSVASRRARHPRVAGARVARGGYHGSVVVTIRVNVGSRWAGWCLLMIRQSLLLLLA